MFGSKFSAEDLRITKGAPTKLLCAKTIKAVDSMKLFKGDCLEVMRGLP